MDGIQVDTFGLRVKQDVCFTTYNDKFYMDTMKRQLRILRELAPMLKQILIRLWSFARCEGELSNVMV